MRSLRHLQLGPLSACCFVLGFGNVACDPGSSSGGSGGAGIAAQAGGGAGGSGTMPSWDRSSALGGSENAGAIIDLPVAAKAWKPTQACVDLVAARLAKMSWREKSGQMVQGDSSRARPADVVTYQLGSVLSGGGSDPATSDDGAAWASMVASYMAQGQNVTAPLLYGIDAVHGHNNVSDAVIFPHNIGLGCTRNAALVEEIGAITALEVRGTGINWTFAPVLAAARDERWGRTYESFSEDPQLAAALGVASIRGLQGQSLSNDPNCVLACAKHFAGDGATNGGVDQGDVTLSESEFQRLAIDQYQPAINAGVGSIMVSYSSFNQLKMSAETHYLTEILKGKMGFAGFLVSDWRAVQQVAPTPSADTGSAPPTEDAIATSINAGLDMIMEPFAFGAVVTSIESAHDKGLISDERIDDAVSRILAVKCEMGLLADDYSPTQDPSLTGQIGSVEHLEVARRAVRESLVLLKNDKATLPFAEGSKILVVGEAADNHAKQCGGWTIDWQGLEQDTNSPGTSSKITTILEAIRRTVGEDNVEYAANGDISKSNADYVVVVLGEEPYAEGFGNVSDITLSRVIPESKPILTKMAALGLPTVVVLLSGRPLVITDLFDMADGWLAAWLPGSAGEGVADVLFGDYAPTGRLSHSWPLANVQIPINVGDDDYTSDPPLFEYGYGLTY